MRRLLRHEGRGQELVEHAIVLPLLLLIFLGIIEFAIVVFAYDTIANAAREGARRGVVLTGPDDEVRATVEAVVVDRALGLGLTTDNISVTLTASNTLRVEVNYTATLMLSPVIGAVGGDPDIPLHTVATMYRE